MKFLLGIKMESIFILLMVLEIFMHKKFLRTEVPFSWLITKKNSFKRFINNSLNSKVSAPVKILSEFIGDMASNFFMNVENIFSKLRFWFYLKNKLINAFTAKIFND